MSPRVREYLLTALLTIVATTVALEASCGERDVVRPAAIYLSLSAADLGTTAWATRNGAAEGNAFMRDHAVAKQLAVAAALTAADIHLQKSGHHRKLRVVVVVLRVSAVAFNLHNARRRR